MPKIVLVSVQSLNRITLTLPRPVAPQALAKPHPWDKAILLNGLECRAGVGSCKLRFAHRSGKFSIVNICMDTIHLHIPRVNVYR